MGDIQYISKRVSYRELPGDITVVITHQISALKFRIFTIWLVLFAISGLLIASQMFVPSYPGYTRIGFFAFACFWGWFMYKAGYAWFWRKSGRELLRIHDGQLSIKRGFGKYGKSYSFLVGNIKGLDKREMPNRSFGAELEKSPWVVGGERISFDYLGREVRFGMQLNNEETKRLTQLFIKWMKNSKRTESNQ